MQSIAQDSAVTAKTRELCEAILGEPEFKDRFAQVEAFLENESSRAKFVSLSERSDALQQKQHSGEALDPAEIREFQELQAEVMKDPTVNSFIEAQNALQQIHNTVATYVAKTLEHGRVPTDEEMEEASGGGCCSNEGCGCK